MYFSASFIEAPEFVYFKEYWFEHAKYTLRGRNSILLNYLFKFKGRIQIKKQFRPFDTDVRWNIRILFEVQNLRPNQRWEFDQNEKRQS